MSVALIFIHYSANHLQIFLSLPKQPAYPKQSSILKLILYRSNRERIDNHQRKIIKFSSNITMNYHLFNLFIIENLKTYMIKIEL